MDLWSNLPPEAWLWLRKPHEIDGLDSAQALAHARACPACTDEIARLTGRPAPGRAA